ncbi:hypothetical protein BDN72DRAFT_887964 [Pluteus cervinus]|uniref:Uncharacterized protein n=1 Tax=Pluteus cervinus TaxID=181527 RepID=A0ACD3AZQ5_9AGAR|nr:hypothetical protein BDN72DRAFT_887964 [Pluteus cervinus]
MSSNSPSISDVEGAGMSVKSGSAWIAARTSERAIAQQAIASDPKFKKYTQQVEKCLASFDSVHEWADFIAFLKQLLKTFQSYMQFKEIPKKLIVSKRLAQCLNPALPTGVHQRALDVYAHILAVLGSEGLKRDLALWSSGLFPFFEYAATSVKPTLLNLYDTHYLPLQAGLRPIMKSFILALLPGLEEETGEFFEKVLGLLDKLSGTVSPSFFFQNIWLVMLTTPSARGTSLNLLARRLPKLNADEDITSVAVEPYVIWKRLLASFFAEVVGDGTKTEAIEMIQFLLQNFAQDEDIQTIHLPVILAGCVELVKLHVRSNPTSLSSKSIQECLKLQEELLSHVPPAALVHPPEVSPEVQNNRISQGPYQFACTFYGLASSITPPSEGSSTVPIASIFEGLMALSTQCVYKSEDGSGVKFSRDAYSQISLLMNNVLNKLASPITVSWDPTLWLSAALQTFEQESTSFVIIDRTIGLAVALHRSEFLQPRLQLDDKTTISKTVKKLLKYLDPQWAPYHAQAVNLIWALDSVTRHSHVESVLAQTLASPGLDATHVAFEAFGVLWRLSEDNLLPGFRFKVPMMTVLDTLRSDDPYIRRTGETWMRCSLKAYSRILDPLLFDLLDPTVRRAPWVTKVRGREIPGFVYERPFDQRYTSHLLELLLAIAKFGGHGFAKTARTAHIRRSPHAGLVQRVDSSGLVEPDASYLDVIVEILLRFLQSEPADALSVSMQSINTQIQSTTIDLLQAIVARGEIEYPSVESIELCVVPKLFFSIHKRRLDLQNKLLHLLHSLISAMTTYEATRALARPSDVNGDGTAEGSAEPTVHYSLHPLLVQTLIDGISTPSNHPVRQHWIDFVLMAIPQFQPALQPVVTPLHDCFCRQLLLSLGELHKATGSGSGNDIQDITLTVTDADFVMLINGLERLVLLSLAHTMEASSAEDETATIEKSTSENSGLFGYVSGVFSSETPQQQPEEQLTARSIGYRTLHDGVRVLYLVWSTLDWTDPSTPTSKDASLFLIYNRTRNRCRRVLEHLFRVQSAEVFESIIDWWNRDLGFSVPQDASFELIDVLMASAQNAIHMLCESISQRMSGPSEKAKRQVINPELSDAVLFKFMEQYMKRLEGPLAIQVWNRFLQLVKEMTSVAKDFKIQNFFALRCLSVLAEKVTQTNAFEDKRIRKELQDNFGKLLDSCVTYIGRSSDQNFWLRRGPTIPLTNGRDSPAPRSGNSARGEPGANLTKSPELRTDEKLDVSVASSPSNENVKTLVPSDLVTQVNQFISGVALPNMRRFLVDNDKITTACTNIVYYIVSPAMKGRTRPMDVDETVIAILYEMTRLPTTLKAWKFPVSELLNDNRFFNCTMDSATKWRSIIKVLFDADKTALPELLAKISTTPSANIFANKEYEMLLRSLNVRRLSFILFTGEKNHFLTQLPTIQEKLVDILRNVSAPIVQSEVFLCIRVLLCRLSPHNLTSFWPVLLTELYRIFEHVLLNLPPDGSEDLQMVLAASKCLDLLLALQTEEFLVHQWIFITDTVDAIYRPNEWFPEAMMDQLAETINSVPISESKANHSSLPSPDPQIALFKTDRPMRRPMLNAIQQIESIRDLAPFFSSVSMTSYESVYASGGNIDWETVESGLLSDMFDGRL